MARTIKIDNPDRQTKRAEFGKEFGGMMRAGRHLRAGLDFMAGEKQRERHLQNIILGFQQFDADSEIFFKNFSDPADCEKVSEKIIAAATMLRYAEGDDDLKPLRFGGMRLSVHEETVEEAQNRVAGQSIVTALDFWRLNCREITSADTLATNLYNRYASLCVDGRKSRLTRPDFPQTYAKLWQQIPALNPASLRL